MTDATLLPFDLPSVRRKKVTVDFDGGIGRVAQPFSFRPHGSKRADFPHPALPRDNLRHAARVVQG